MAWDAAQGRAIYNKMSTTA